MFDKLAYNDEIIVCLFDGKYHFGLAALINSLVQAGFKGLINVGYRGILPPWVNQLKLIERDTFCLNSNIIIHFEVIETNMHLAFYKPYFIRTTFSDYPHLNKLFYFDVDINVSASWSFFSDWLDDKICLCLDVSFELVHANHPWRNNWKKLANVEDSFVSPMNYYVNSGFIGLQKSCIALLDKWIELTERFKEMGGNVKEFHQNGESSFKGDQDLLNAAITVCPEIKLSLIGREGMGFTQPAYLMTHAILKDKPWNKNFLIYLIKQGRKPTRAERNFFAFCRGEIKLFTNFTYCLKKTNLNLAILLGRYIGS